MIRLGHITYSNCYPVHARLLEPDRPEWLEIVPGMPSELNAALERRAVDVAPASSIEFARHPEEYRVLPGLSIATRASARTILLASRAPLRDLHGAVVGLPTASASSVVLLKILLEVREGIRPHYVWFDQRAEDPLGSQADAALFIGDMALQVRRRAQGLVYDLGMEWVGWTGLPFVFALWQTWLGDERADDLRRLHTLLGESRAWAWERLPVLAVRTAAEFGWEPVELASYWESLDYGLDQELQAGLARFYTLAAELGELPHAPRLRFLR